jgi:hypothetical protein
VNPEWCAESDGRGEFVCRGCYRICPLNPRLKPGVQEYCSRPSCQQLRQKRWDNARLRDDPKYREHRRATKAGSRRKCAARDAARKCETLAQKRAQPPPARASGPIPIPSSLPAASESGAPEVSIQPGLFLIRPAGAPACATKAVEISAVWFCPSPTIEQISSGPETDAFLLRQSSPEAAERGVL